MSAVAEPIPYGTIDDGLARRNAMVLAVARQSVVDRAVRDRFGDSRHVRGLPESRPF